LFALRWKHVDEGTRCLTIAEAVYREYFDTPKTEKSKRLLPLSAASLALLREWKRVSTKTSGEDLIFGTRMGNVQSPNNILRRYVFPACAKLGLQNATWLTFRRTYASWSHNRVVPDKVTAELMGHSRVYTTLNVYTQVMTDSLRKGRIRLAKNCSQLVRSLRK
jgi:integrase